MWMKAGHIALEREEEEVIPKEPFIKKQKKRPR